MSDSERSYTPSASLSVHVWDGHVEAKLQDLDDEGSSSLTIEVGDDVEVDFTFDSAESEEDFFSAINEARAQKYSTS